MYCSKDFMLYGRTRSVTHEHIESGGGSIQFKLHRYIDLIVYQKKKRSKQCVHPMWVCMRNLMRWMSNWAWIVLSKSYVLYCCVCTLSFFSLSMILNMSMKIGCYILRKKNKRLKFATFFLFILINITSFNIMKLYIKNVNFLGFHPPRNFSFNSVLENILKFSVEWLVLFCS